MNSRQEFPIGDIVWGDSVRLFSLYRSGILKGSFSLWTSSWSATPSCLTPTSLLFKQKNPHSVMISRSWSSLLWACWNLINLAGKGLPLALTLLGRLKRYISVLLEDPSRLCIESGDGPSRMEGVSGCVLLLTGPPILIVPSHSKMDSHSTHLVSSGWSGRPVLTNHWAWNCQSQCAVPYQWTA